MPHDANGYWYPDLSPKQLLVYNCYKRYTCVSGPKKSGKTIVNLHRLLRHAVETPKARIGVFAKTVRNAKSGGIWNDITEIVTPEWIDAHQTRFTSRKSDGTYGPKQDPQSRMVYFKIRNHFNGESEFQLHSIDNESEVESISKGTRFSCFYFAELSNFRQRMVFDITSDQLRMPNLPFVDHLWLSDTNPADDGEDSWIYKLWYGLPKKENPSEADKFMLQHLRLIEIMIPENPYLDEQTRADLYARFAHDPDLYARYIEGRWVRASKEAIFVSQWRDDSHKIGDANSLDEKEWMRILPSDQCTELITGWDLGDRFHSAHIAEALPGEHGAIYTIIDEINHIDPEANIGISEFCDWFMARYEFWMNFICGDDEMKRRKFSWRHWSDKAALSNWRAGAETYDKNLVYKYTGGNVELMAAPKFPGSIGKRINIGKILLFENRLLVSAPCFKTVEMFKSLRAGKGAKLIADQQPHRHVFDSLTYLLSAEEPALLMQDLMNEGRARSQSEGPIAVPL